jgi:hypothetical protein
MSNSTTTQENGKLDLPLPDKLSQLTSQEKPVLIENGNIFINNTALKTYLNDIPEKSLGKWKISSSTLEETQAACMQLELMHTFLSFPELSIPPGEYKRLCTDDEVMMSDTRAEISGHYDLFNNASGRILINGLGLGIAAWIVDKIPEVDEIWIQEIDADIIELIKPSITRNALKVKLFQGDAFYPDFSHPAFNTKFDYIWNDIWPSYSHENIPEFEELRQIYLIETNCRKTSNLRYLNTDSRRILYHINSIGCWSEELSNAMKWRGDFAEKTCRTRIEKETDVEG